MSRATRVEFPGAVNHAMGLAMPGAKAFPGDEHRGRFLQGTRPESADRPAGEQDRAAPLGCGAAPRRFAQRHQEGGGSNRRARAPRSGSCQEGPGDHGGPAQRTAGECVDRVCRDAWSTVKIRPPSRPPSRDVRVWVDLRVRPGRISGIMMGCNSEGDRC
jgi:hypothetical protein